MNLILVSLLLSQWALAASTPPCRIDPNEATNLKEKNAGCFLVFEEKLLMVRGRKRGKLTIPAGKYEKGELAQCTAHRETFEESGVSVIVHELLKKFKNDFHLFRCTPLEPDNLKGKTVLPASKEWLHEVTEVQLASPLKLKSKEWRYPKQLKYIKKKFKKLIKRVPVNPKH